MFENFVIFTEVVKLSSNLFQKLQRVNYSDECMKLISERRDLDYSKQTFILINDVLLLKKLMKVGGMVSVIDRKVRKHVLISVIANRFNDETFVNDLMLLYACTYGFSKFAQFLLDNGIKITHEVFEEAIRYGHLKIVKRFTSEGWKARDEALIIAAARGHLDIVKYLLHRGASINAKDGKPLEEAACRGEWEVAKYLVRNGAKINDKVLEKCIQRKDTWLINYLIRNGADIRIHNDLLLKYAVEESNLELVRYVIEKGADIHSRNEKALIKSIKNVYPEMVKYLIEKGADVNFGGNLIFKTAIRFEYRDFRIIRLIVENGLKLTEEMIEFAGDRNCEEEIIEYLQSKID